jgi:hypothetical protein
MKRLVPMLPVKSMPASVAFYQKLRMRAERSRRPDAERRLARRRLALH